MDSLSRLVMTLRQKKAPRASQNVLACLPLRALRRPDRDARPYQMWRCARHVMAGDSYTMHL